MQKQLSFIINSAVLFIAFLLFLLMPYKRKKNAENYLHTPDKNAITLEKYQKDLEDIITKSQKDSLNLLIESIASASDSLSKVKAYSAIISYTNRIAMPELAAMYVMRKAEWVKNTNSWVLTGDNFINLLMYDSVKKEIVEDIKQKAIYSYQKATELDSLNIEAKLKYAQSLMELKNEPMQGVQILLKIVEKDPNQIDALLLLAKFGLVSGQTEKVEQRLAKILSLEPNNIKALLMKADLLQQTGKAKKAEQIIQKIISMPNISPSLKEQLKIALAQKK